MKATTDVFYHGNQKQTVFFEGWYLKHQVDGQVYAFIPGISIEKDGQKNPFIQIINDHSSHTIFFRPEEFFAETDRFFVRIGDNLFSEEKMVLAIEDEKEELHIHGTIYYQPFRPLEKNRYSPSIMGPFSYAGFLECYHGILSLGHELSGQLSWNGQEIDFSSGKGYIEKDWGTSFPKNYLWVQSNVFPSTDASFFFSLADIPFLGFEFLGLIAVLAVNGRQYRLATYHGGKAARIEKSGDQLIIEITQKELTLQVAVTGTAGKPLLAPTNGGMNRIIRENANAKVTVTLLENETILFSETGQYAGFEEVGKVRGFDY